MPPTSALSKTQRKKRSKAERKARWEENEKLKAMMAKRSEHYDQVKAARAKAAESLPTDAEARKAMLRGIFNKYTRGVSTKAKPGESQMDLLSRAAKIAEQALWEALDLGFTETEAKTVSNPLFKRFMGGI